MLKKFIIAVIFLTIILAAIAFGLLTYTKSRSLNFLEALGFPVYTVETFKPSTGSLLFTRTAFDPNDINTVETYQTSLTPQNRLIALIENMSITGEWKNNGLDLGTINRQTPFYIADFGIEQAIFKNITASILTPSLGGLSFNINGRADKSNDDTTDVKFTVDSAQHYVRMNVTAHGTMQPNAWNLNGEINNARLIYPPYDMSITRAQGTFSANQNHGKNILYFAQLNAGGLKILNTDWQNASITLERREDLHRTFITANALFNDQIELSFTKADTALSASIFAPTATMLIAFLKSHKQNDIADSIPKTRTPVEMKISNANNVIGIDVIDATTQNIVSSLTISH